MYWLDVDNDCLIEILDDEQQPLEAKLTNARLMEISLQALSSTYNLRTMRLKGLIGGRDMSILIDGWSTHCFIQDSMVYKLGLELRAFPEFHVFIGSSEFLVCNEVCRRVNILIQGAGVQKDLFMLAMGDANMVFRVQWLETLGNIVINHKNLTMQFMLNGKRIFWKGDEAFRKLHLLEGYSRSWSVREM